MKRFIPLAVGLALLAGCAPKSDDSSGTTTGASGEKKLTIAMIPKGTQHDFWKSVQAGAEAGAKEAGVELIWKGPVVENDKDGQIKVVEDFITKKVDGIGLAPLDDTALKMPVKEAQDAGIPVLIFDSGIKDSEYVSFVATDNKAAGKLGGTRLGELMNGNGKVLLMRYVEGSASTTEREEGFLEAIKTTFPAIQVVSSNQYAGATVETAQTKAESLIGAHKFDGVFCPNESAAFGMMRALENAGLAGKVKFVGFDASEGLLKGLTDGHIDALVVQNPFQMGKLSVEVLVNHIKGQRVQKRMDTGAMIVDRENMDKPEVKEIVGK